MWQKKYTLILYVLENMSDLLQNSESVYLFSTYWGKTVYCYIIPFSGRIPQIDYIGLVIQNTR